MGDTTLTTESTPFVPQHTQCKRQNLDRIWHTLQQDSIYDIATTLLAGWLRNWGSTPGRGKRSLSSSHSSSRIHSTYYSSGTVGSFLGSKMAREQHWTLTPSGGKFDNQWRYTSMTPYTFTVHTMTTQPFTMVTTCFKPHSFIAC